MISKVRFKVCILDMRAWKYLKMNDRQALYSSIIINI